MLRKIITKNFANNAQTIFTYTPKDPFNGKYNLFCEGKLIGDIEWSDNRVISNGLNNVIHGYLRPQNESEGSIPNGLFIGTNWYENGNARFVSNSVTTIFGLLFIVSIEVSDTVKIILTKPNMTKTKRRLTLRK